MSYGPLTATPSLNGTPSQYQRQVNPKFGEMLKIDPESIKEVAKAFNPSKLEATSWLGRINNFGTALGNYTGIFTLLSSIGNSVVGPYVNQYFQKQVLAVSHRNTMKQLAATFGGGTAIIASGTVVWVKGQSWLYADKLAKQLDGFMSRLKLKNYTNIFFKHLPGLEKKEEELLSILQDLEMTDNPNQVIKLYGPPGTGKTESIRAIAGHLARSGKNNIEMYTLSAATLVGDPGTGAKKIAHCRKLLNKGSNLKIVFIDEADSFASNREKMEPEAKKVANEFLQVVDGAEGYENPNTRVLWLLATNEKKLDSAIESRCETTLLYSLPTAEIAFKILQIHLKKAGLQPTESWNMSSILPQLNGMSGRSLKNVVNNLKRRAQPLAETNPSRNTVPGEFPGHPTMPNKPKKGFTQAQLKESIDLVKGEVTEEESPPHTPTHHTAEATQTVPFKKAKLPTGEEFRTMLQDAAAGKLTYDESHFTKEERQTFQAAVQDILNSIQTQQQQPEPRKTIPISRFRQPNIPPVALPQFVSPV